MSKQKQTVFASLDEALSSCRRAPLTKKKYSVVWPAVVSDPDITNRDLDVLLASAGLSRDTKVIRNVRESVRLIRESSSSRKKSQKTSSTRLQKFIDARARKKPAGKSLPKEAAEGKDSPVEASEVALKEAAEGRSPYLNSQLRYRPACIELSRVLEEDSAILSAVFTFRRDSEGSVSSHVTVERLESACIVGESLEAPEMATWFRKLANKGKPKTPEKTGPLTAG